MLDDPWWMGFACALNLWILVSHLRRQFKARHEFVSGERVRINVLKAQHLDPDFIGMHGEEYEVAEPLDGWVELKCEKIGPFFQRTLRVRAKCLTRVKKKASPPPQEQPVPGTPSP